MRTVAAASLAAVASLVATSAVAMSAPATPTVSGVSGASGTAGTEVDDLAVSAGFRKGVTQAGIIEHLKALQAIGDANGGTRVSGTPGFEQSVDYVVGQLKAAGYDAKVQDFEFLFNDDRTPPALAKLSPAPAATYVNSVDYATMTYSGSGDVEASVWAISTQDATPGCEATDFAGFTPGSIALVPRGSCTFAIKAQNAHAAGATAVVVSNNTTGVINGTLGGPVVPIPVVGATKAVGAELSGGMVGSTGTVARVKVDRLMETRTTHNIIAETPGGDPDNVVVVGAHLDSVSRGPGINDNGSGSATILEVAQTYAAQGRTPTSKVRFIWWGAEESGLLGSRHYVGSLSQAERDRIRLNLNFDMISSPNYVRFVYDGDNSAFPVGPGAAQGPAGSGAIESMFHSYFSGVGLASAETPFSGRSDYGPFIEAGIPAGGLFTGAEGTKTAQQAAIFGGQAGVAYDKCYHLGCDTFANVNQAGLDEMSDAVAHGVLTFSRRDFTKAPLVNPAKAASGTASGGEGGGLHVDDHEGELS
jgi:Zn-dependent M28 family amino/carboxypeptidase